MKRINIYYVVDNKIYKWLDQDYMFGANQDSIPDVMLETNKTFLKKGVPSWIGDGCFHQEKVEWRARRLEGEVEKIIRAYLR